MEHDSDRSVGPANAGTEEKPANTQFSCQQCRSRKLKCDRRRPTCSRCVKIGVDCEYPESRRANFGTRKRVHELESKLEELERLARGEREQKATSQGVEPVRLHLQSTAAVQDPNSFASHPPAAEFGPDLFRTETTFSEVVPTGLFEQPPSSEIIIFLTNAYFEKWYWAAAALRRSTYLMSLYLPPHMRPPMCLQYIVMALGADMTKTHRHLSIPFYQRARRYIEFDENRGEGQCLMTVAHAQCWVLISNFEALQLWFAIASMSLCRAVRVAQMLGLHRVDGQDVSALPLLPPPRDWVEAEERRRTWWVIYCSDYLTGPSIGAPVLIDEHDIQTNLPASEIAFETGMAEPACPFTNMLHVEGHGFSAFGGRVLASSVFYRACHHPSQTTRGDDPRDLRTSEFWKRHREIDNDLFSLLQGLPDDLRLPGSIRSPNATFVNIIIHASVICLHRAAIAKILELEIPEDMAHQSRARLVTAAEEIIHIFKMVPDANETLKNPMLTFMLYAASLVFLDQPESAEPDYRRQSNLDFILRILMLAGRTWNNAVTGSLAVQLATDMNQRGLSSLATEKAAEMPLLRSLVPIMARGDSRSPNFLFQLAARSNGPDTAPNV
ncbi:Citrinin biosynthesis transcriptional activator ctnR [Colletotrichum spinosum]|uniref:Citrinin biosynthesis transcriptional activator ctnR n=1 Tax=Colletotrichum spinosum TaxID=1347390 RepID=A0A4R8PVW6_9PEZI|nr:Citrinin biosynthesis transcriptional activator ctnR [Colletotrichum spinosum]